MKNGMLASSRPNLKGLSIATKRTKLPVCIEMNSLSAVNIVNGRDTDMSVYASLVAEIKHLKSLRMTRVTHISRGQNVVSDIIASFAKN